VRFSRALHDHEGSLLDDSEGQRPRGRHAPLKAALLGICVAAVIRSQAAADPAERTSTLADQRRVNVTIYNGAQALVHDRRRIEIRAGENRIAWRDVSANIDATSAILEDLSVPGGVAVVEQNFNYDLLKPSAVLDKYVGHQVIVVHDSASDGHPQRETATLLSDNEGVVLQYRDRLETSLPDGHLVFPAIPGDLRDRPTLVLEIHGVRSGEQTLDLAYLTGGLGWHADYVGVVAPDEKHLDLSGLVTLSNTSGTTYENAHLQLVAGNVNFVQPPTGTENGVTHGVIAPPPQFEQQNYFEYHLYTLGRTTTIANNQTKQVSLLSARDVPIRKTLELRGSQEYYYDANADLGAKLEVGVYVTFANKGGDLGIPLPGGTVRLYKNDNAGTSQFLGSDSIDHTPRNEDVRLHLGDSFDVTANKKQTEFHALGGCTYESSYQIVVKNAKTDPVDVVVVEPIPGDWSIVAENLHHQKTSSATASWTVHVPADSNAKLTYTAHVKLCF
jgi:hypothetical protein